MQNILGIFYDPLPREPILADYDLNHLFVRTANPKESQHAEGKQGGLKS